MEHPRNSRMDHQQQEFLRSTDGRFLLPHPMAMPSLSTGQGFYTVESLQGASFIPPPQIGPPLPPPSFLPSGEPYIDERSLSRAGGFHHYINRCAPSPLDRDLYSPPPFAMPRPPFPRPSPHFRSEPRNLGFREFIQGERSRPPWAMRPHRPFNRKRTDIFRDRSHPRQQHKLKSHVPKKDIAEGKGLGSASEDNLPGSSANLTEEVTTAGRPGWCCVCQINCHTEESLKKHLAGKRHKRRLECEKSVEKPCDGENGIRKPNEENHVEEGIVGKSSDESKVLEDIMRKLSEEEDVQGNVEERETIAEMNKQVNLTSTAGTTETVVDPVEVVVDDIIEEKSDTIQASARNEVDITVQTTSGLLYVEDWMTTSRCENLASGEDGMTAKKIELVLEETDKEKVDAAAINVANASAPVEIQIAGKSDDLKFREEKEGDKDSFDLQANAALRGNKRSSNDCADVSPLSKKLHTPVSPFAEEKCVEGKNQLFRQVCELCHVTCTSKRMLETHLKTKRHAANLKKNGGSSGLNTKQSQGGDPSGRLKKGSAD